MKPTMLQIGFANELLKMLQATRFAKMEFELAIEMMGVFYGIHLSKFEFLSLIAYLKIYNFVYVVDTPDGEEILYLSHDLVSCNQNYEINKYYSQFYHIEGF